MLVVLKRSHTDLQSLQAPCLTFSLIVIQASCFFSIWFGLFVLFIWWSCCRCLLWLSIWSGTAGYSSWCRQDRGSLCRARCYLWVCVTPRQAISWVAAALAQGEACSLHLPPLEGRYQSGGNGGSGASAIPAQVPGCFLHSTEQVLFSYPPLITGCVCMDLKPGYFHVPQLERLEKTFTSVDTHKKEILAGYHHRGLAASFFLHGFSFLCKFLFL